MTAIGRTKKALQRVLRPPATPGANQTGADGEEPDTESGSGFGRLFWVVVGVVLYRLLAWIGHQVAPPQ